MRSNYWYHRFALELGIIAWVTLTLIAAILLVQM
jgi:hypothetical protein